MKRYAAIAALLLTAEAAKCKKDDGDCNSSWNMNKDSCSCECRATCDAELENKLELNEAGGCRCEAKVCETACAPNVAEDYMWPEGVTAATADDYTQAAYPGCGCTPVVVEDDPAAPCDAKYGGEFTMQTDGEACPTPGCPEGQMMNDMGECEMGALKLLSGAFAIAAALLI